MSEFWHCDGIDCDVHLQMGRGQPWAALEMLDTPDMHFCSERCFITWARELIALETF